MSANRDLPGNNNNSLMTWTETETIPPPTLNYHYNSFSFIREEAISQPKVLGLVEFSYGESQPHNALVHYVGVTNIS